MAETYNKVYKDKLNGMSYKEIADKYGVSINTAKSWSRRHWAKRSADNATSVHTNVSRQSTRKRG